MARLLARQSPRRCPEPNPDDRARRPRSSRFGPIAVSVPAVGHGLNAVEQDVEQRLLHLARVGEDRRQVRGQAFLTIVTWYFCASGRTSASIGLINSSTSHGAIFRFALAGEVEQIAQRTVQALDLPTDFADDLRPLAVEVVLFRQHFHSGANAGQRVPNLMGDSRGQFADRGELAGLLDLFFVRASSSASRHRGFAPWR